jgi:hypothetical protein
MFIPLLKIDSPYRLMSFLIKMELLSDHNYNQLTAAFQSPRTYTPYVGDYLVTLHQDWLHNEAPGLYRVPTYRSRNTVLTLYRITKITRNSIYTSTHGENTKYLRWGIIEGAYSLEYPRGYGYWGSAILPKHVIDAQRGRDTQLPSISYRHRNDVFCIGCNKMINIYRHHPHPETILVPEYESYVCDSCHTQLSEAA